MPTPPLYHLPQEELDKIHASHHKYIDVLIEREEQRIAFRQAIIEKTLSSLLWSVMAGTGVLLWQGFMSHFK